MLMKSPPPMIGPDTWLEKTFCCFMVILGLFVTTQLVAVVTQMVLAFDKANAAFRDAQQEYIRFASSRNLPSELRRKLLTYSMQDWSVNVGMEPGDIIRSQRLPTALSNKMLRAIYDDVAEASALLKVADGPVIHQLLRYMKVIVALQKESLIKQSDPCTCLYILRQGGLQASASEKLLLASGTGRQVTKMQRSSTWKQKMQLRMIERCGDIICCRSPYEPPQPLPFQITSVKRSTLVFIHMQDLHSILGMIGSTKASEICNIMASEHDHILQSVKPKDRSGNPRESTAAPDTSPDATHAVAAAAIQINVSEQRIAALERDVDACIVKMQGLVRDAKCIPRMVAELSRRKGRPMQPMPRAAQKAVDEMGIR